MSLIKDIDFTKIAFELSAKEDIIDYTDGTVIYKAGQSIGKYNLTPEGTLIISDLWMGKYILKEISTIEGAVLDETQYDIEFTQEDTVTKEYIVKPDIENNTTEIEISKTDITGEQEIEGAILTLLDENDEIIDTWVSTKEPHKIEGLKVGKKCTLKEEQAPDSFVKAETIEFIVKNTVDIQKIAMVDKVVEALKVDVDGNPIEGIPMQVLDLDGNLIDEWVSEKEPHKVKNLEENKKYILHEEINDGDYVRATDVEFLVTGDKEIQSIVMVDKAVEALKVDVDGNPIEGIPMKVLDVDGNLIDEWVSEKEPHKVKNLEENKKYILHEEINDGDYVRATDVEFLVTGDKEIQSIVMVDKAVEALKVDVDGNPIEGIPMKVLDVDGNLIDEWVSKKEPHKIKNLEENKNYILCEEISRDNPYVKATDMEFNVSGEKEIQRIVMVDKEVEALKVDIDGNPIEGVPMQVLDLEENILDEWVSGKEPHKIKNLIEGKKYILREKNAIGDFVKATDMEFNVSREKEIQRIVMVDKIVEMSKVDIAGNEVVGAKMQVFDLEGNLKDDWISAEEPHKIKNLEENESYILHEEVSCEGYVKATDMKFNVSGEKEIQRIVMVDKRVIVKKTDFVTGKEVVDARLTVTDEENNIIDQWTSTTEEHYVSGLEEGKTYTLTEVTCPYRIRISREYTIYGRARERNTNNRNER